MGAAETQQDVDGFVRSDTKERLRAALIFDGKFLQDVAEWKVLPKDLAPCTIWKAVEVNFNGTEFHRLFGAVECEHDLAEVLVAALLPAYEAKVYGGFVKTLQRRGHVTFVHKQRLVWLRDGLAVHPVKGREIQTAS